MAGTVTDKTVRVRIDQIKQRLADGLPKIDPHHRLVGRPVSYEVISGQTLEIVYRDVPRIEEAEVLGIKRLVGEHCYCSVSPQGPETLTVTFVMPLEG